MIQRRQQLARHQKLQRSQQEYPYITTHASAAPLMPVQHRSCQCSTTHASVAIAVSAGWECARLCSCTHTCIPIKPFAGSPYWGTFNLMNRSINLLNKNPFNDISQKHLVALSEIKIQMKLPVATEVCIVTSVNDHWSNLSCVNSGRGIVSRTCSSAFLHIRYKNLPRDSCRESSMNHNDLFYINVHIIR